LVLHCKFKKQINYTVASRNKNKPSIKNSFKKIRCPMGKESSRSNENVVASPSIKEREGAFRNKLIILFHCLFPPISLAIKEMKKDITLINRPERFASGTVTSSSELPPSPPPLEEMDIIELQGTLSVPDHLREATRSSSSSHETSNKNDVFLGTIERQGGKKVTLNIGTLVVEGEVNPYKKKVLLLRRVDAEGDEQSTSVESRKRPRDERDNSQLEVEAASSNIQYPEAPMLLEDWLAIGDNEERMARAAHEAVVAAATASGKPEYKVVGVAVNHYLFKSKPSRIFK
jgi:hypothetical protein